MKILIASYFFHPDVGGISTATALLAQELIKSGEEVRIVTRSASGGVDPVGCPIVRDPGCQELMKQVSWCEVVLSMHLSVRLAWPLLLTRRPWVIAHHGWLTRLDGSVGWLEKVKHALLRRATCIAVSRAVAKHVATPSIVIAPPYDESVFYPNAQIPRDQDLLFVGRLVSSKGVDVMIEAVADLRKRGLHPQLKIVGEGPERGPLEERTRKLKLENQVEFLGLRTGSALSEIYCAHRILVVPSITPETFGIVALEAIACGCVVVASDAAGGLSEAIGPCGATFQLGNADSLADRLADLLADPQQVTALQAQGETYASAFTAPRVADQYLAVLRQAVAVYRGPASWVALSTLLGNRPT